MNDPILRLEILRNNLVELISNMELLFSTPLLRVDINNIPEGGIEKLIKKWKSFNPIIAPYTLCEITYKIDEKYQKMIDMSKEHLSLVNQEIQKFKQNEREQLISSSLRG